MQAKGLSRTRQQQQQQQQQRLGTAAARKQSLLVPLYSQVTPPSSLQGAASASGAWL